MSQFRKKPVVIEASQWFTNGDHPDDACVPVRRLAPGDPITGDVRTQTGELVPDPITGAASFLCEGAVVRYFRHPGVSGQRACEHPGCLWLMNDHGWIDTLEGGHIVCPGDWIITGVKGERYPCKPDIFAATYEPVAPREAETPERNPNGVREDGAAEVERTVSDVQDAAGDRHRTIRGDGALLPEVPEERQVAADSTGQGRLQTAVAETPASPREAENPQECHEYFQTDVALCFHCGMPKGHAGSHGWVNQQVLADARDVAAERKVAAQPSALPPSEAAQQEKTDDQLLDIIAKERMLAELHFDRDYERRRLSDWGFSSRGFKRVLHTQEWYTRAAENEEGYSVEAGAGEAAPQTEEPEAGRYFTNITGFRDSTAYLRVESDGRVIAVNSDGEEWHYTSSSLGRCIDQVQMGKWREITSVEAAALLVPPRTEDEAWARLRAKADTPGLKLLVSQLEAFLRSSRTPPAAEKENQQ